MSIFEILSNSIDEAREGYGKIDSLLPVTRTVPCRWRTMGRGIPVDFNSKEGRVQLGAGVL